MQSLHNQKLTIHGDGSNKRHYLAAEDFTKAILTLIKRGKVGEIYNIGSENEYSNQEVAAMICDVFGFNPSDRIAYVADRPFNDCRYAVVYDKIKSLGWQPAYTLEQRVEHLVQWYSDNRNRYDALFKSKVC